jgi:SAM-dependent methyltransferase
MLELAFVGIASGLFEALDARGPAGAPELATAAGKDPGYVIRYCDAAYAYGLLSATDAGAFALTELGRAFLPNVAGSLMPFPVGVMLGAHMMERSVGLMETGERPGEAVLAERDSLLPWFGPMLEAQYGPFFRDVIAPGVPIFDEVDARGGLAVDLGCGNGWYLRALAHRCTHLRGIGLDGFGENIAAARRAAERDGLGDRLDFHAGDLHDFTVSEPAHLIAMNRALHHVWNEKDNVFRILRDHLAPGGAAVIWEPAWPKDRAALTHPPMRPVAFQNLAEHIQGNHFLHPDEIAQELEAVGLTPQIYLFAEGREAVVVGRRASRV